MIPALTNVSLSAPTIFYTSPTPPEYPDLLGCNNWYAYPDQPTYSDCIAAWNALPQGDHVARYDTINEEGKPQGLLFVLGSGRFLHL